MFPTTILRLPYSLLAAVLWTCIVYYPTGLAPEPSRCEAVRRWAARSWALIL